jgi:hypothetical protein
MSAGAEATEVLQWVHSQLAGGTALAGLIGTAIYDDLAPQEAEPPYIVAGLHAENDVWVVRGTRIAVEADFLVKAVTRGNSYIGAASIMALADPLLAARGTVVSGAGTLFIIGCRRTSVVQYPELDSGVRYNHVGGVYRITAESA